SFLNALEPVNFIICLYGYFYAIEPFELKNNWTGERLTLRRIDKDKWLLVRCPIVREEDKWAKWEEEAIKWQGQQNFIGITFSRRDIGDGMVEANPRSE
ncbi:hypothetical protein GPALN_012091, partial [Globodera pallida]